MFSAKRLLDDLASDVGFTSIDVMTDDLCVENYSTSLEQCYTSWICLKHVSDDGKHYSMHKLRARKSTNEFLGSGIQVPDDGLKLLLIDEDSFWEKILDDVVEISKKYDIYVSNVCFLFDSTGRLAGECMEEDSPKLFLRRGATREMLAIENDLRR